MAQQATAQPQQSLAFKAKDEERSAGRTVGRIVAFIVLVLFALVMFVPFLWALSTSLKSQSEVNTDISLSWIPPHPTLQAYFDAWHLEPFGLWYLNSLIVAIIPTVTTILLASMAGYSFARIKWPGRDLIFLVILGTMMVPFQVYMIPLYIILQNLHLINNYGGLTIPVLVTSFGIFLMKQFFTSIPQELEEAARVDGASRWTTFWRVVLPLAGPALSALAIFTFMGRWNDFLFPLLVINNKDLYTLPIGINLFRSEYYVNWPVLMAASLMIMIPVVIVYIAFQRYFIEGIAFTGLKG